MLLSRYRKLFSFKKLFFACLWLCHALCTFPPTLYIFSSGWQQKYKLEKTIEPFRDNSSPRRRVGPKVLHNTNFLPPFRCSSPVFFYEILCFVFLPAIFCFFSFHFQSRCELHCIHWWLFIWSLWVFISASAECALVKEKSFFYKHAYRYKDESTLINAFSCSLPYIFLFIPVSEVLECCDFSHPRHELFAGCASENQKRRTRGRGKKRRDRKGRRTGHTSEKAKAGTGVRS